MLLALLLATTAMATTVTDLRCESQTNPLGLDVARPRLSWRLVSDGRNVSQTAYQLRSDGWDSGQVVSHDSIQVPWPGPALHSAERRTWQVRVWDQSGQASAWSDPASFEMGLFSPADWQAQWLNDGRTTPTREADQYAEDPAPLFRREFAVRRPVQRARLYICGLGYYEASLNGGRVGDHMLDPGWTRYTARALYSTYDVTEQVHLGRNCLGVMLGKGWYDPLPLRMWGHLNLRDHLPVGRPRFIARLELRFFDGGPPLVVVSDPSWKVSEGPIRFDNTYLGEVYDARREQKGWNEPAFADAGWRTPTIATEPVGPLRAQSQPPIRVTERIKPVAVTQPRPDVLVFDFGRNFGGWARIHLPLPSGARLVLRYGELLAADGTVNPLTSVAGQIKRSGLGGPGAPDVAVQSDTYIARGSLPVEDMFVPREDYTPRFTFHAFRYLELTGYRGWLPLDPVEGLRLNTDVPRVGSFACGDPLFNEIQQMCDRTFLSNLFSVQSDCPHRERFGYGGDLVATSAAYMANYDMSQMYAKSVRDWADNALPDGMLTDTAPFVGIQYCGLAWAMAHPFVLRQLYQVYGDRALVEEQYPTARRWLELVATKYPNHIVTDGLSDHESLAPAPAPELVTPLYAESARTLAELAAILGRDDDVTRYRHLAADIETAYRAKFVDGATGKVGPATQASQAFGLWTGIVPPAQRTAALGVLLADVAGRKGHLSTGILGSKFMLDQLSREGHAADAAAIVRQPDFPGWANMLSHGATTLWEHWEGSDNTFSHNHPMFGSVSEWFYRWLGGIQVDPAAVGADRLILAPQPVPGLSWVRCSWNSVRGPVVSRWTHEGQRFAWDVEVPPTATAEVRVPTSDPLRPRVERVGSGKYHFESVVAR